ncbi:MAG: arsenite efflux transporter metallochaperone ArsD [Dehalococcoidia bacterium]
MTKSFIIYESAMCCSSGVCGPNPDKSLIDLQDALDKLKDTGAKVERYSITGNPKKFRENPEVVKLIQEHQIRALPITTFNGRIIKIGAYPSIAELEDMLQTGETDNPVIKSEFVEDEGCCSGKNCCDISCGPSYKKASAGGEAQNRCF